MVCLAAGRSVRAAENESQLSDRSELRIKQHCAVNTFSTIEISYVTTLFVK